MAAVRWTFSVEKDLLAEFRRVCKERGRSQSFYIQAAMRRVVGWDDAPESAGVKTRRKPAKKKAAASHSE